MAAQSPSLDPAVAAVLAFNHGRDRVLVARKYAAMRRGAFSFMRGTCHLFYAGWPADATLDSAPATWLSGDLHAENFGTYRGDNRLTYFDVTDFDETALGPVTWDLGRFVASLIVGGTEWGMGREDTGAMVERAMASYRAALSSARASWIERETARGLVKRLFAQISGRSRTDLLDHYTHRRGRRRRITVDGRRRLSLAPDERAAVEALVAQVAARSADPDSFAVIDAARRVSGLGSLGLPRYLVLIEGRGSPDRSVLLDVKTAHPSVLAWRLHSQQPGWPDDAQRVAGVHAHSVAVPPAILQPAADASGSYVVRELQPSDDRVHLRQWARQPRKLVEAVCAMSEVAAWTHLRGAGWRGSDTVERLAAFGGADSWVEPLLTAATSAADRVNAGFAAFAEAYDRDALAPDEVDQAARSEGE